MNKGKSQQDPKKKTKSATTSETPGEAKPETTRIAELTLKASVNAGAVISEYGKVFGTQDINALIIELQRNVNEVQGGNLSQLDAMLFAQANSLQAIFTSLARKAISSEYMDNLERYLRLALKAQAQCTKTLEVLATMKNPAPIAFVRQANIGQAVQVNNGASLAQRMEASRARESENTQNKLLEKQDGNPLDTGTTCAAGKVDQDLEAVGAIHRTQNQAR